ncbi:hypothetical protein AVEN_176976-1 [Araneus ventricosus]|uniref:Uncharacterized protein n=1 Tax=Araneus ventricosus TaxID=182803 RepID=A0A4Y2PW95_ARAVE|nr:hypothetical protein AVEN_176976-1 [Araneus ventricosus]
MCIAPIGDLGNLIHEQMRVNMVLNPAGKLSPSSGYYFHVKGGSWWPSGKILAPGSKPNSTEDLPCLGLLHVKSYIVVKRPPIDVVRKFGKGVPVRVSSSLPEPGSKLGASQNPYVASKRDVNN